MEPTGEVTLCKNLVLDRYYQHTIDFKDPSEQLAYWGSLAIRTYTDFTYIRKQRQFIRINANIDALNQANYLYFRAKENGKLYFCFVTDIEYYSENTTCVYFEIDIMQTYLFDFKLNESYVLQEHVDRWDANHKPIYSRTDEGLDYGAEYTLEKAFKIESNLEEETNDIFIGDNKLRWYLAFVLPHSAVAVSNATEEAKARVVTRITGMPNPYILYLIPGWTGTDICRYMDGDNNVHNIDGIDDFLEDMANSELGAFVKQIVRLPYLPIELDYKFTDGDTRIEIKRNTTYNAFFDTVSFKPISSLSSSSHTYLKITSVMDDTEPIRQDLASMDVFNGIESALPTSEQWEEIKSKPRTTKRDRRFESKLLTYPYRYNLLTDWRNTPVVIKNEYIGGDKITIGFTQSLGFNAPTRYFIKNYKKDPEGRATSVLQLGSEEIPLTSDEYYNYMLANRNQIDANRTTAIVNSVANTGKAIVGGAVAGGSMGGIWGAIGGAVVGGVSGAVDGTVNYTNMIRQENARQDDLKNMPDTIINSNDAMLNALDRNEYLTLYRYKICCEFEEILADTFNMTGYTVKRVKVPNLKTRTRFNYIKTIGANVVPRDLYYSFLNQDDLNRLKQIFDNGITFWHYNANDFNPLDYSYENIETSLI